MTEYDYVIYGGGPTGLTLAYFLSKNNYKVALVEKENILGGCWKVEWNDTKYFTEHSPRVLIGSDPIFFDLLKEIGYKYNIVNTYGNNIGTKLKMIKFFKSKLSFFDTIKCIKAIIFKPTKNETFTEWMNNNNISNKGKKALTILSIVLANSPDKLLAREIFDTVKISKNSDNLYQLKNNMGWINKMEAKLIEQNVAIFKETSLITLVHVNNNIKEGILNDSTNLKGKKHILTLPPIAFKSLLKNNNYVIKNNWMNYSKFEKWVENSYYISFGFQFHFKEDKSIPDEWCWSCMNDYKLIILPTSKYADEFTRNSDIKTVWSCTIVDTNSFIKDKNKTVNDMTKKEIIDNIKELLNINPFKTTIYDGVEKIDGRWISKDSAFSVGKSGIIKKKGNIDNLYTVGPHNFLGITSINKAIKSAKLFLEDENIKVEIGKSSNLINYILIFLISIIIIWILKGYLV
jgi:hypothetical protein